MGSRKTARRKSIRFHIDSGDYFGTLATVLDLLRQDGNKNGHTTEHNELLETLIGELLYLQASYRIIRKGKEEGKL
jgi:hypothetical protein